MTIVFLHIPKAAGTSLKQAISERIGPANMVYDYHRPMAKARWRRNGDCLISSCLTRQPRGQVVFGHFLAGKYAHFTGSGFIKRPGFHYAIFFREPLQRAVSHYHFWKRTYLGGHRVWERFTRENWSLERFLLSTEHVDFQAQFVWRFPIELFNFIGLAEHYRNSLEMLGWVFPVLAGLDVREENINTEKSIDSVYRVDPGLAEDFKRANKIDYSLYARAEEIFLSRRSCFLNGGRTE